MRTGPAKALSITYFLFTRRFGGCALPMGKLHHMLNDQRVNKVNLRKEFFRVSLDDIENLVAEVAPTAEFKRTVLAEQYRQSLSISHVQENPASSYDDDDDEDVAE